MKKPLRLSITTPVNSPSSSITVLRGMNLTTAFFNAPSLLSRLTPVPEDLAFLVPLDSKAASAMSSLNSFKYIALSSGLGFADISNWISAILVVISWRRTPVSTVAASALSSFSFFILVFCFMPFASSHYGYSSWAD